MGNLEELPKEAPLGMSRTGVKSLWYKNKPSRTLEYSLVSSYISDICITTDGDSFALWSLETGGLSRLSFGLFPSISIFCSINEQF